MPTTRSCGSFETALATWHIASSGFETTTMTALRERRDDLLGHRRDDRLVRRHEVVPAHARLAGQAGGDHDHVRALRRRRSRSSPDDVRLVAEHGAGLVDVECLPCGKSA